MTAYLTDFGKRLVAFERDHLITAGIQFPLEHKFGAGHFLFPCKLLCLLNLVPVVVGKTKHLSEQVPGGKYPVLEGFKHVRLNGE